MNLQDIQCTKQSLNFHKTVGKTFSYLSLFISPTAEVADDGGVDIVSDDEDDVFNADDLLLGIIIILTFKEAGSSSTNHLY